MSGQTPALHEPFSWLDRRLAGEHEGQFFALTKDVCSGVQTCLELVHSSVLARDSDLGDANPPILSKIDTERLLLLATASARMLHDYAEERIDFLNDQASKRR